MTLLRTLMLALAASFLLAQDSKVDPKAELNDELLAATRKGDLVLVKALLAKGADVNAKSPYGSTPLFFACDRGHTEIAKLLIEKGADLNVEDTFYHATALTWATMNKRLDTIKLLLDNGAKSASIVLQAGVQSANPQIVKIALAAKPPVDAQSLSMALAAATKANKPEIVELLKAAGATPPQAVKTITLDEATLQTYAGVYQGGRGGTEFDFTFTVKDGKLMGAIAGQPSLHYAAIDKTHFVNSELGVTLTLEFIVEGSSATGLKLNQGGTNVDFKRKAVAK
jgi:hypothetical protein